MYGKFLLRDLGIAALTWLVWRALAPLSAGPGPLGDLAGFVAGGLLGICAFLAHEWGHLLGALATRSALEPARRIDSPFLFDFDSQHNSRAQFLAMSLAGFAATGLAIALVYGALPPEWLATRIARGAVAFLTLLGVTLEFPLVGYALIRGRVPPLRLEDARAPSDAAPPTSLAPAAEV